MRLILSIPIDDAATNAGIKKAIRGVLEDASEFVAENRAVVEEAKPGDIPLGIEKHEVEGMIDGNVGARLVREDCSIPF